MREEGTSGTADGQESSEIESIREKTAFQLHQ